MKREFKISKNYNESELFRLFGENARFLFGAYFIDFNGKILSVSNPSDLFQRLKVEYEEYVNRKK